MAEYSCLYLSLSYIPVRIKFYETHREKLLISTDPSLLDIEAIYEFLFRAYWAQGRTRQIIDFSLENSLLLGLYGDGRQIGLARVVTDYATFAWLCDVFIHEDYRGQGTGKWLKASILSHPDLQGLHDFCSPLEMPMDHIVSLVSPRFMTLKV